MKKLILLIALLFCFTASAQLQNAPYVGIAKVVDINQDKCTIVFSGTDFKAKTFIVRQPTKGPELTLGVEYYSIIKRVKFKGSKLTGEIIYHYEECSQNVREVRRILDSIPGPKIML